MRQTSPQKKSAAVRNREAGTPSLLQISLVALLILAGSEMLKPSLAIIAITDPLNLQALTIGVGTIVALLVAFLTRRGHLALQDQLADMRLARHRSRSSHRALLDRTKHLEQSKRDLETRLNAQRQTEEALQKATAPYCTCRRTGRGIGAGD